MPPEIKVTFLADVCQSCGDSISLKGAVMLKDDLWLSICNSPEERICVDCIESRLGRPVVESDLKRVSKPMEERGRLVGFVEGMHLPFNLQWLYRKGIIK